MESYRLKNIILLLLVVTNFFLLATLLSRWADETRLQESAATQLVQLFSSRGVELDAKIIPKETPSTLLTLTRSSQEEEKLAAFFLGSDASFQDDGGGLTRYQSDLGTLTFLSSGDFNLTASLSADDPQKLCDDFFQQFHYQEATFSLEKDSGTVTAMQYFDGRPVVNCTVTLTFSDGVLVSASGRHLPSGSSSESAADCISAATALTSFLQALADQDRTCSQVRAVELGYALQNTPATPLSLTPVWRITTDSFYCYVNSISGEVVWN